MVSRTQRGRVRCAQDAAPFRDLRSRTPPEATGHRRIERSRLDEGTPPYGGALATQCTGRGLTAESGGVSRRSRPPASRERRAHASRLGALCRTPTLRTRPVSRCVPTLDGTAALPLRRKGRAPYL